VDNELEDLREALRQCQEEKLVERLRTDNATKDLRAAHWRMHLPRYWLGRLYVVLSVLTNISIFNFVDVSLGHAVLQRTGTPGWIALYITAGIALLGMADVIINDILPHGIVLTFALRWRHLIYMALSLSLASLMFLITAIQGNSVINFVFGLDMAMAASIGILTPFARHRWIDR
jgi:hypothetical protein